MHAGREPGQMPGEGPKAAKGQWTLHAAGVSYLQHPVCRGPHGAVPVGGKEAKQDAEYLKVF